MNVYSVQSSFKLYFNLNCMHFNKFRPNIAEVSQAPESLRRIAWLCSLILLCGKQEKILRPLSVYTFLHLTLSSHSAFTLSLTLQIITFSFLPGQKTHRADNTPRATAESTARRAAGRLSELVVYLPHKQEASFPPAAALPSAGAAGNATSSL